MRLTELDFCTMKVYERTQNMVACSTSIFILIHDCPIPYSCPSNPMVNSHHLPHLFIV